MNRKQSDIGNVVENCSYMYLLDCSSGNLVGNHIFKFFTTIKYNSCTMSTVHHY